MIGFDRQNARGLVEVVFIGDERRGAMVGGHPYILENVGGEKKIHIVGERVEIRTEASQLAKRLKTAVEVDDGFVDDRRAQRGAQKQHVFALFYRNLLRI